MVAWSQPMTVLDGFFTMTVPDSTNRLSTVPGQKNDRVRPRSKRSRLHTRWQRCLYGCSALASSTGLAVGLGPRVTLSALRYSPRMSGPPLSPVKGN